MGQYFRVLIRELEASPYYQFAYCSDGSMRHPTLLENLISPNYQRELVSMMVPVKKRIADPTLFDKPTVIAGISIEEIEAANSTLWTVNVTMDGFEPIYNPYYEVNSNGEAEFISYIDNRMLSTGVEVSVPFRIDIEFRAFTSNSPNNSPFGMGLMIYHGISYDINDPGRPIPGTMFGVNMDNSLDFRSTSNSIIFNQPTFGDKYTYPKIGAINQDEFNSVTWIVGDQYLACIINGEVRYCGTDFPYMRLPKREFSPKCVYISSDGSGKRLFRKVAVTQLQLNNRTNIKQGELTVYTKKSNNIIPTIHRLVTSEYGENYWFNGSARYVMECVSPALKDDSASVIGGELFTSRALYDFFAGMNGDIFIQHYMKSKNYNEAISDFRFKENPEQFIESIFSKIGYSVTCVSGKSLSKNPEMYLQTLMGYIDKGVPVICNGSGAWGDSWKNGVIVGYEDYGKVLLYITGNNNQPYRVTLDTVINDDDETICWVSVSGKTREVDVAQLYRGAIYEIPQLSSVKADTYCFGSEAFRRWASDIENGSFDSMTADEFDTWGHYTNYVCVLSTNGSCCHDFLKRAMEYNPDMTFLSEVSAKYQRMADMWNKDEDSLEVQGTGFNITLELLQDPVRRSKLAAKIREFAACADDIVQIINSNIKASRRNAHFYNLFN